MCRSCVRSAGAVRSRPSHNEACRSILGPGWQQRHPVQPPGPGCALCAHTLGAFFRMSEDKQSMCTHDTNQLQQPQPHSPIWTPRTAAAYFLHACLCCSDECYVYTTFRVYNEGGAYTRVLHDNTTVKCQWCLHVPLLLHLQLQRRLQSRTAPASTRSKAR